MDIRDILKSFDSLSEAKTTTDKGVTTHKGDYGREFDTDEEGNAVVKKVKSTEPKPKGRRPDPDRPKLGKDDPKNKKVGDLFGRTTGAVPKGKKGTVISGKAQSHSDNKKDDGTGDEEPTSKKSLKEYFDQMDEALYEAALAVQPLPATPQQKQQQQMAGKPSYLIKDPANPQAAITTQSQAVVDAAKNGTMSMQKPGAAPTAPGATPAAGAGSQVKPMEEGELDEMWGNPYDDDKVDAINAANPPKAPSGQPNRMTPKPATQVASAPRQANTLDHDAWDKFTGRDKVTEKDVGKHNNATTGFDALVRKLTPKYGKEAATKIAGAQLKKMSEAEAPPTAFQSSPLTFEGKKGVNPFAKKDTKKKPDANKNGIPDYAEDGKGPNDTKKKGAAPKKGVNPFAKKTEKKKVKEGMEHHLQAARLEGKSHALRKMPYNCTHDDMEEARCYHDGFKEGLDECYGQMPILGRTAVDEMGPGSEVDTMASYGAVDEGMGDDIQYDQYCSARDEGKTHEQAVAQIAQRYGSTPKNVEYALNGYPEYAPKTFGRRIKSAVKSAFGMGEGEMDEGTAFTAGLAKTPHGGEFKVGGSTFTDRTSYDSNLDEFAFESLDKQLNSLLESEEKVSEGMTVSISKGQQGAPDSVSVSAQDGEADQLLSIIKSAGMGLFGGDEHNGYGAPQGSAGAHGGISVVDDHDGMMALMKKLSGGGDMMGGGDYEDEEGHEGHSEEGHSHEGEEDSCNECGYMESKCQCDHGDEQQVVDEVESEDQMEFEVAEANAPVSGADNTNADVAGQVGSDAALAKVDGEQDMTSPTNEAEDETGQLDEISQELAVKTLGLRRAHGMDGWGDYDAHRKADATEKRVEKKFGKDAVAAADKITDKEVYGDRKMKEETVAESFANLYKKLAFLSEEMNEGDGDAIGDLPKQTSPEQPYQVPFGANTNLVFARGKRSGLHYAMMQGVLSDPWYFKFNGKVYSISDNGDGIPKPIEKVDESYANSADDTFETDIDFMTKVISGGLNKQKSTGQTTISVIAGQKSRMGVDGLGSPMKESNDLLKDYRKLSGL